MKLYNFISCKQSKRINTDNLTCIRDSNKIIRYYLRTEDIDGVNMFLDDNSKYNHIKHHSVHNGV